MKTLQKLQDEILNFLKFNAKNFSLIIIHPDTFEELKAELTEIDSPYLEEHRVDDNTSFFRYMGIEVIRSQDVGIHRIQVL